jgi:nifR3 family TIM-barrel protein
MNCTVKEKLTARLAPMAGYTDLPFRRMCRKFGLYYGTTALIDAGALVHNNPDSREILHRGEEEEWLQVQILGSIPDDLKRGAEILRDGEWHFDAMDFNMGCPVRKVLKRHAGAGLLNDQELAFRCVQTLREVWPGKFTVKLRILHEEDPEYTLELCRKLVALGVEGITIHGRLPEKIYSGPVHGEIIRAVREALPVPVVANGGIFSRQDALALVEATGCSEVMVARGTLGNPWIFRELAGITDKPSQSEVVDAIEEHIMEMVREYGETTAMILGRKIVSAYLSGRGFPSPLRASVVKISTLEDFSLFLKAARASLTIQ